MIFELCEVKSMNNNNLNECLKKLVDDIEKLDSLFADYYLLYVKNEFSEIEPLTEAEKGDETKIIKKMSDIMTHIVNDIIEVSHALHNKKEYSHESIEKNNKLLVRLAGFLYDINTSYHTLADEIELSDKVIDVHDIFIHNIQVLNSSLDNFNKSHNEKLYNIEDAKKVYKQNLDEHISKDGLPI